MATSFLCVYTFAISSTHRTPLPGLLPQSRCCWPQRASAGPSRMPAVSPSLHRAPHPGPGHLCAFTAGEVCGVSAGHSPAQSHQLPTLLSGRGVDPACSLQQARGGKRASSSLPHTHSELLVLTLGLLHPHALDLLQTSPRGSEQQQAFPSLAAAPEAQRLALSSGLGPGAISRAGGRDDWVPLCPTH